MICIFTSCTTTRELRATILDTEGNPVPNTLFYAESFTYNKGTLDFTHSKAGLKGEVPPEGNQPLAIRWQSDAKLAFAVFAPGKSTVVVLDRVDYYNTHDLIVNLRPDTGVQQGLKPDVTSLAFPFEKNEELQTRIKSEEYRLLIQTFLQAYEPVLSGEEPAGKRERKKAKAVERIAREMNISTKKRNMY